MNGPELYPLLFRKHGALTDFAKEVGISIEAVRSKFKAIKGVDSELLRQYAAFKKYDENDFLAWANGPVQSVGFDERTIADGSIVSEPAMSYGGDFARLKQEFKKVMQENVQLHNTVADRGQLIIHLLDS